jgi:WxL domain surface cell wall-binding
MRYLSRFRRPRVAACLLLAGGALGPVLLTGGAAQAAGCGSAVAAGTTCTVTGTLALTSGTLAMTSPSSLAWGHTITGADQQLADTTAADEGYSVADATGTAPGWHSTVSATQFTTAGGTPSTMGNTGTFYTTGSVTSMTATTSPSSSCASGSTCTLPTNTTTYPVAITTAATTPSSFTIYDASAATGSGTMNIGGSAATSPVGWWLAVPANTPAGSYTSTITLELISGP